MFGRKAVKEDSGKSEEAVAQTRQMIEPVCNRLGLILQDIQVKKVRGKSVFKKEFRNSETICIVIDKTDNVASEEDSENLLDEMECLLESNSVLENIFDAYGFEVVTAP